MMLVEKGDPGKWAWGPGETEISGVRKSPNFFLLSASVSIFLCPSNLSSSPSASSPPPVCTPFSIPVSVSVCLSVCVALSFYILFLSSYFPNLFLHLAIFLSPFWLALSPLCYLSDSPLRPFLCFPTSFLPTYMLLSPFYPSLLSPSISVRLGIPASPSCPSLVSKPSPSLLLPALSLWDFISLCAAPSLPRLPASSLSPSVLSHLHPSLHPPTSSPSLQLPSPPPAPLPPPSERVNFGEGPGVPGW